MPILEITNRTSQHLELCKPPHDNGFSEIVVVPAHSTREIMDDDEAVVAKFLEHNRAAKMAAFVDKGSEHAHFMYRRINK